MINNNYKTDKNKTLIENLYGVKNHLKMDISEYIKVNMYSDIIEAYQKIRKITNLIEHYGYKRFDYKKLLESKLCDAIEYAMTLSQRTYRTHQKQVFLRECKQQAFIEQCLKVLPVCGTGDLGTGDQFENGDKNP